MAVDIRGLIRQMHAANPLWGAPRIHGELRKLGIEIEEVVIAPRAPWQGHDRPERCEGWRARRDSNAGPPA